MVLTSRLPIRSPGRVQCVAEHIRSHFPLWVWPFSGVSPLGFSIHRARFQSPMLLLSDFLRLIWPLLTPARSPCTLPHRALPKQRPLAGQVSPDKNAICHYTTAAFTLSPKPRALSCCADLPGDWALYAISVRRLIVLHSGFLQTVPHGSALAFG
jgi:hypothetical protein